MKTKTFIYITNIFLIITAIIFSSCKYDTNEEIYLFNKRSKKSIYKKANNINWVNIYGVSNFLMGNDSGENDERPLHKVNIDNFKISKFEISNSQYCMFLNEINCESNGYYKGTKYIDMSDEDCLIKYSKGKFVPKNGKANFPVVEVSWYGADAFAEWVGGRLPTEAEWEFTASGGDNSIKLKKTNISRNLSLHEVNVGNINSLGLYNMTGNVWEWCSDWYDDHYYSKSPVNNPKGPEKGNLRVLRGGSWGSPSIYRNATNRNANKPDFTHLSFGFRVVK